MAAPLSAISPTPPEMLDLERLGGAIPGKSRVGVSLRYEADYDRIREARRDEDPSLPQGIWQRDLKRADWKQVIALCTEVLCERSKDLQIACWLVEALLHRRKLPGLADGLRCLVALCDGFWQDLFPAIDDGDVTARIAPIEWLNDKLPPTLYTLPLTSAEPTDSTAYSWTDYVNAQRQDLARGSDTRADSISTTIPALDDFFTAAGSTSTVFYEKLAGDLGQCLDGVAALQGCLDRWCGKEAPGLAQLRDALSNLQAFVDALLAQRHDKMIPARAVPADEPRNVAPPAEIAKLEPSWPRLQIGSRDEAYHFLVEIADYLFEVEPHSPTPYIVQRAASWGRMPLSQLLVELTKGNNDLSALFELLGVGRDGGLTKKSGE